MMFYLPEGIIYGAFLLKDCFEPGGGIPADMLKYTALFLCVVRCASLPALAGEAGLRRSWLKTLLWLAAAADVFLLSGYEITIGLVLFIGVQRCYAALWLRTAGEKKRFLGSAAAAGAMVLAVILIATAGAPGGIPEESAAEAVLAAVYGTLLVQNALAIAGRTSDFRLRGKWLSPAIGLLLLCDLHVGLYNVFPDLVRAAGAGWRPGLWEWYRWTGTAMWLFYLPSALCVVGAADEESGTVTRIGASGKQLRKL